MARSAMMITLYVLSLRLPKGVEILGNDEVEISAVELYLLATAKWSITVEKTNEFQILCLRTSG